MKDIPVLYMDSRSTIVYQDKSIDTAYKEVFEHAHMFVDPMLLKKNMGRKLGIENATGLLLYMSALHAPSTVEDDNIISQYGPVQKEYLSKYEKYELYRTY